MQISEKQALEELVSLGIMEPDIAEILRDLARDKMADIEPLEGYLVRPLLLLLDKSSSMTPLKQAMIDGQHHLINSILGSSTSIPIYFGQFLFNHEVEYFQDIIPFRDPSDDRRAHPQMQFLDRDNYTPKGGTALYDAIGRALAMSAPTLAGAEELGQQVTANIAVITDGRDEHSITKPDVLKKVIDFVLETGLIHRITLVGLGNYDYEAIGKSIGIDRVIQGDAEPKEIRRAMDLISSHMIEDTI